ncbi:hypothetical protein [Nocardioides sp. GXZ039]|uniref:hypothetical protein n=1 Tax=Nocardioides sp. GXZ039 TaxID=3136018 RepID=UPI0030F3AE1F
MTESTESTAPKAKTAKVGDLVKAATVCRPGSSIERTVYGGQTLLDVPGVYVIDGVEVTVK